MIFTPLKKDDFDKSFKFGKQSFQCYSEKKLRELCPDDDFVIIGLARRSDKTTDSGLELGQKCMAVFSTEKDSFVYRSIGYIPVKIEFMDGTEPENCYIAVQESRVPFA